MANRDMSLAKEFKMVLSLAEFQSRRRFLKAGGLGFSGLWLGLIAGWSMVTMVGCNVFADILSWTNIAGPAIDGIVTILGSFMPPGAAVIISGIKATITDLAGAVVQYQNDANPADKSTTLNKIKTLLSAIASNFQNFLSQLNISSSPILAIVFGLAKLILGAIAGFMGQLPVAAGTKVAMSPLTVHVGTKDTVSEASGAVEPKLYKHVRDFQVEYNTITATGGHSEVHI